MEIDKMHNSTQEMISDSELGELLQLLLLANTFPPHGAGGLACNAS